MRFIPGEESWGGPSKEEMAFVAPLNGETKIEKQEIKGLHDFEINLKGTDKEVTEKIIEMQKDFDQEITSALEIGNNEGTKEVVTFWERTTRVNKLEYN